MPRIQSFNLDVTSHRAYLCHQIALLKRRPPKAGKNSKSFCSSFSVFFQTIRVFLGDEWLQEKDVLRFAARRQIRQANKGLFQ